MGEWEREEGMVEAVKMGRLVRRVEVVQGREVVAGVEEVAGEEGVVVAGVVVAGEEGNVVVSVGARTYAVMVSNVKPPGLTCEDAFVVSSLGSPANPSPSLAAQ